MWTARPAIAIASASAASSGLGAEHVRDHPLHLPLLRAAVAADSELDLVRLYLVGLEAELRREQQHDAARLPHHLRRRRVSAEKELLDGHHVGRKFLGFLFQLKVEHREALRERQVGRRLYHAVGLAAQRVPILRNDPVAQRAEPGVYS